MTYPQPMAAAVLLRYYPPEVWEGRLVAVSKLTDEQWDEVRRLDADGMPRTEIARQVQTQFGVRISHAYLSRVLGPKTERPSAASRPVQVLINDDELEALRELAAQLGYEGFIGRSAGVGSLSALLRAIARGEVKVERS